MPPEEERKPENGWKKWGKIVGTITGTIVLFLFVYKADCYNLAAKGKDHFATIPTVLAMQAQFYYITIKQDYRDVKQDIRDLEKDIKIMEKMYGANCQQCPSDVKERYKAKKEKLAEKKIEKVNLIAEINDMKKAKMQAVGKSDK